MMLRWSDALYHLILDPAALVSSSKPSPDKSVLASE